MNAKGQLCCAHSQYADAEGLNRAMRPGCFVDLYLDCCFSTAMLNDWERIAKEGRLQPYSITIHAFSSATTKLDWGMVSPLFASYEKHKKFD